MNPRDPRDEYTQRYESGYQPGNYRDEEQDREYGHDHRHSSDYGYGQYPQPEYPERPGGQSRRLPQQQEPDVDIAKFAGGVFAAGVVTALAAWLCAWIIKIIAGRVTRSGNLGVWNPIAEEGYWFALVAFVCTVLAGVLWYLLRLGTPSPELFFGWIVGLLTAAAVIVPPALTDDFGAGIATAIEHLVIGLPILSMIRVVGAKSVVYR